MPAIRETAKFLGDKVWRWEVVGWGAAVIYGLGAAALFGDEYLLARILFFAALAWMTAKAVSWEEIRGHEYKRLLSIVILIAGVALYGLSEFWIHVRKSSVERSAEHIAPRHEPAAVLPKPPEPISEQPKTEPEHSPAKKRSGSSVQPPTIVDLTWNAIVISNNSDATMYVEAVTLTINEGTADESTSIPINSEIGAHKRLIYPLNMAGSVETLPPSNMGFVEQLATSRASYADGCITIIFFTPNDPYLKQAVDHYRSIGASIPVGVATGTISYQKGASLAHMPFAVNALVMKRVSCTTQRQQ